jgi:radical SAM superfamily enzyme YgiQ (UPF0313 family)
MFYENVILVIEQNGADVKAVDMFDFSWDRVRQTLEKEPPDAVGITCLTEQRASPLEVAKLSKTINKDCTVIMGGIHTTIMCEQILEHWPVDIIVLGEGEETIKELMICLEKKQVIGDVHGIAYKYQGKIIRTPPRQLIHNLDDISFPAYKYFDFADDIFTVNKNRVIDLCKEIIDRNWISSGTAKPV